MPSCWHNSTQARLIAARKDHQQRRLSRWHQDNKDWVNPLAAQKRRLAKRLKLMREAHERTLVNL